MKKIPNSLQDTYSNVFSDSIKELVPKYPNLTEVHTDEFFHNQSVINLIKDYFKYPDKQIFYEKLSQELANSFTEGYFSKTETENIILDFLDILDHNIKKDPKLEEDVILAIVKNIDASMQDIYRVLNEYIEKSQIHLKSFYSTSEFYIRYLDSENLFNHKYKFVGRKEILSQLDNFIESNKKIALLSGRGGIGKSRILLELGNNFETKHEDWELRYLSENPLTSDSIRELPTQKCVIVVDDAHRREDIVTLLEIAQQAYSSPKIILAFRPYGLDYIKYSYTRCGFDIRKIEVISEVDSLEIKEREELGKSILGPKYHQFLESLLKVAKDSTIVLVIGAQLIAENKVHPAFLEQNKEFQETVFRRFQEDIISSVSNSDLDSTFYNDLLSVISILSPIQPNDEFFERTAKFLSKRKSSLTKAIDNLRKNKILYSFGYKLRITPDLFSDHVLYNSCITLSGVSNGYSQEIFENYSDIYLENILRNVSELDWRANEQYTETGLLTEIWDFIVEEFKNASNLNRIYLLEKLNGVAYFQPKRTLELIEYAINNPTDKSEKTFERLHTFTHYEMLGKTPTLLEKIAYNIEYLPHCCKLLWYLKTEMNQKDSDQYNSIKILKNLARYELYKPLKYNDLVLDFIEHHLKCSDDPQDTISLLDIIDPMLKKDDEFVQSIGFQIKISLFPVSYQKTKTIRERALSLISDCLKSDSPNIVMRALNSLNYALNPPNSIFGRIVSDEEINSWIPEQIAILDLIKDTAKSTTYSVIKIKIRSLLELHARHEGQVNVEENIKSIIDSIPDTFDIRLARAMGNYYDTEFENYENHREQITKEMKSVTKEFLIGCNREGKKAYVTLKEIVSQFEKCGVGVQPQNFLNILGNTNYEVAIEICNCIFSDRYTNLKNYINELLSGIRVKNHEKAIEIINDAIDSKDIDLCKSIARGYTYNWAHSIKREEIEQIKKLLDFEDEDVKEFAIKSLRKFSENLKSDAFDLALTVEIGNSEKLADAYCSVFNLQHAISPASLDNEQLKLILHKISQIKVLENNLYHINTFLTYCSARIPEELTDFLLERIDLSKNTDNSNNHFQPLPYIGFYNEGLNGISLSSDYKKILIKVRDHSLKQEQKDLFWIPKLYSYISNNFSSVCLEVLTEWINTKDELKIKAVGNLIQEAPFDFVFLNSDFVSDLLINAHAINSDCFKEVIYYLFNTVDHGGRTGIPGQLIPQDEIIRDRAQEFMKKYKVGSPTWKFYNLLCEKSKNSIEDWIKRDEEMLEE